jgi:hypothetical protein
MGCCCRCVKAIFLDFNAFSHQPRVEGYCNNNDFSLGQESKFVRSGIDMQVSIRYLGTRDGFAEEPAKSISIEQRNAEKCAAKTSTVQQFNVRSALDKWVKSNFQSQHRLHFLPTICGTRAGDVSRLDKHDTIVTELDMRDFSFQESRLWTHAEDIHTDMRKALTTEDDFVEQEQSLQHSSLGNDNRYGTIVTTTDPPLPHICELDLSQSATGSVHDDDEEARDNYTVVAGMLAHSTEESQQASTARLRDFAVLSVLSWLPGFTLSDVLVHELAVARARPLADWAFRFTSNETHRNVTPTPTTASHAVTPQATAEGNKSIPCKCRRDSQQTVIEAIQR